MGKIFQFNDIFPTEGTGTSTPKTNKQLRGIRLNIIMKMMKNDPELRKLVKERLEFRHR